MGGLYCFDTMFVAISIIISSFLIGIEGGEDTTPSWVDVCGSSYLFSEHTDTWENAVGNCELYGSHILQIDNMEENYCLLSYAHSQGMKTDWWWHSGNDIQSEGVYTQADGKYILWQPIWNGIRGHDCLMVCLDESAAAGHWMDEPCTALIYYICERE